MKHLIAIGLLLSSLAGTSQKYILLDKTMAQPAYYSDHISAQSNFKGFFPVERNSLPKFLKALHQIAAVLEKNPAQPEVVQYKIGCIDFNGVVVNDKTENRPDYVITSNCDNITVRMHLCDSKTKNSRNAYFIRTWIKYIEAARK